MNTSLSAVIIDMDGTLVDTNAMQVDAWLEAFESHGYRIGRDRLNVEVGKGGDQLVPDLLGKAVDRKEGESLRKGQSKAARKLFAERGVKAFAQAESLLTALRARGLKTALATSSGRDVQEEILTRAGLQPELFDVIVSGNEVAATKPHADLYLATTQKLGLSPAEIVNIGDTPYDCTAARRAGLVTLGLSGDLNDADTLRRAGARATVPDLATLYDRLDEMLERASPRRMRLTQEKMDELMQAALAAASRGMAEGEVPIGCALADGEGALLTTASNRLNATQDKITHAEIVAFHDIAGKVDVTAKNLILISTLEPCVMCLGASMVAGIETVIFGLPAPADGGCERVIPPASPESQMPRIVGNVLADQSRALLQQWLQKNQDTEQAKFVNQLLTQTQAG